MKFCILLLVLICLHFKCADGASRAPVRWCTISNAEQSKCTALAAAVADDYIAFASTHTTLQCIQTSNHDECMRSIDNDEADIVSLDANEIFLGGRYHSLVPIMKNVYQDGESSFYSVAVVKRDHFPSYSNLRDLRNTTACFPSVASMGGWVIPIARLMESGAMMVKDCNNYVKSASAFFAGGCAVNVLSDKHNPLGDNTQTMCSACGSPQPGQHCTSQDRYAGYHGALLCLLDQGDVAFLKHTSVSHAITSPSYSDSFTEADFELLCLDGTRAPLSSYLSCNWGVVPADTVVTSSAKGPESRVLLQDFLKIVVELYGNRNMTGRNSFFLFESSPKFGSTYDALLSDDTASLVEVPRSQQNFKKYLSTDNLRHINTVRSCPVSNMTLCVTSRVEFAKCWQMRMALNAQLLKPEVKCMNGGSSYKCMAAIHNRDADVAVLEAGDIYLAGLNYDLIPIMAERYNLPTSHYYVVAVSKEDDMTTDVLYLRNRRTCHPSVMHGGGWVLPLDYLINNDLMRGYGCNSLKAASQYFSKSCAPGALSDIYRYQYYDSSFHYNLCHLCHGTGSSFCARDHTEDYFGFTGAFQCLVEGGGDVAFLKHTTVPENTDGKRRDWWARNQLTADYQLLCRDGTRRPVTEYLECHLGKVRANAIVTRGGYDYNETEVLTYTNLFLYAQQFFGRDSDEEWDFQMFNSKDRFADVIFQDATQQLLPLPRELQHYHEYLGPEFLNARYRVDCTAGSIRLTASATLLVLATLIAAVNA
ncbi:Transferrin-like domain [Trinorchestia longiramus]|nr:Transferrin-like domain [Trinorchestia longiramus]